MERNLQQLALPADGEEPPFHLLAKEADVASMAWSVASSSLLRQQMERGISAEVVRYSPESL
jgi:hypothetical protein